ncbi:MAG: two-component sensor histidine kinase [Curvibacter sp. PD_MW3]|nr:MAG: two-component sensor histidine kinase [Curvibacter sp. PD_MW3]
MSAPPSPQEQELSRLRAELQAARDALGDFAYVVSHDLRANLRHISAYAGLVREELGDSTPADVVSYLDTVTNAAKLMGRQIDGLMAWSQLDRAELDATTLDVQALVVEARHVLAAEAAGRQIDWQVAADLPRLRGDAVLLRQLFAHLLSNALKFTRPRAPAVISIGWQPADEDGLCLLFVRDNGVGFNPQQQGKLFHVFQRLHSASEFEGQGLGLALARKIVERHGGSIRAEGAPDAGCCIRFTLPLAA